MNRKVLIIIIISILSLTLISGIIYVAASRDYIHTDAKANDPTNTPGDEGITTTPSPDDINEVTLTPQEQEEVDEEIADFVPATKMDLEPSSITVFVNKEFCIPKTYKPENLVTPNVHFTTTYHDEKTLMRPEAGKALEKLFAAAEKAGYHLTGVSAYRSYYRQYQIFRNNIKTQGKTHTLKYSAVPGTSEHQTGLSIDISTDKMNNNLDDNFGSTPEGMWVAKNAHLFGFIVRYPNDKANITGYAFEPWHIRYVGRGLAYYMYQHNLTLEEYYNYTPSPTFDFEALYADIIHYTPPTPRPTATITPTMPPTPSSAPTVTITPTKPLTPTKAVTPTTAPTTAPTTPTNIPNGNGNNSNVTGTPNNSGTPKGKSSTN